MKDYISIALITLSVLLVAAVLLQQMGSGLSSTFGGGGAAYQTRRGFEKLLFRATIVLGLLIITGSVVYLAL